jgi:signal transduction histidine kinase
MAATPEKTCLPQGKQSKAGYSELCPSKPEGQTDCPNPSCSEDLLQQFNQLQERFQRTTNALASAAHDLKTPLAILNGYVNFCKAKSLVG